MKNTLYIVRATYDGGTWSGIEECAFHTREEADKQFDKCEDNPHLLEVIEYVEIDGFLHEIRVG